MEKQPYALDCAQLICRLQERDAYPHPVDAVQTIQTHVSCVFLTGDYAYKVKKPVDFGFLDYHTLSKRHLWCEQELRLNRRLCPDLYLGVLPITVEADRFRVGGNGAPVEWAVQMRQLRPEKMLPQLLKSDAVTPDDIVRLARRLAEFHRNAPTDATIGAYGSQAAIADTISVTLATMDTVLSDPQYGELRSGLRDYLESFPPACAALFAQRCEEGWIRDCHGDLRAQNICFDPRYDSGVQVFDCIEFNNAFRYIDVAADIAYLAMDLDLAGRTDLRAELMDVYLQETGDSSLSEILPFYLVYRAVVRGNIALLAAGETEIPEEERQAQRAVAAAAYDLALSYTAARSKPTLWITVGFSGSGKSVLAKELVRRLPAVRLSSDRLRKAHAGAAEGAPLNFRHYTASARSEVYRCLRRAACDYLNRGQNVLLDATFLDPQEREAACALARDQNVELWMLHCRAPDAVIRQRLQARCQDPNGSDAGLTVYEQQRYDFARAAAPLVPAGVSAHLLTVDTAGSIADAARRIVRAFTAQSSVSRMASHGACDKMGLS